MTIELGRKVKDKITGFSGIVTGLCQYISGCNQALVAPTVGKDGVAKDSSWFDEQRLEYVGTTTLKLDNGKSPGFDRAAPKR